MLRMLVCLMRLCLRLCGLWRQWMPAAAQSKHARLASARLEPALGKQMQPIGLILKRSRELRARMAQEFFQRPERGAERSAIRRSALGQSAAEQSAAGQSVFGRNGDRGRRGWGCEAIVRWCRGVPGWGKVSITSASTRACSHRSDFSPGGYRPLVHSAHLMIGRMAKIFYAFRATSFPCAQALSSGAVISRRSSEASRRCTFSRTGATKMLIGEQHFVQIGGDGDVVVFEICKPGSLGIHGVGQQMHDIAQGERHAVTRSRCLFGKLGTFITGAVINAKLASCHRWFPYLRGFSVNSDLARAWYEPSC